LVITEHCIKMYGQQNIKYLKVVLCSCLWWQRVKGSSGIEVSEKHVSLMCKVRQKRGNNLIDLYCIACNAMVSQTHMWGPQVYRTPCLYQSDCSSALFTSTLKVRGRSQKTLPTARCHAVSTHKKISIAKLGDRKTWNMLFILFLFRVPLNLWSKAKVFLIYKRLCKVHNSGWWK
jgi:hypothetical protein